MSKNFLIICFVIILSTFSKVQAGDLDKLASDKIGEYFSNLIPGDGLTEASVNLRENSKPDFSVKNYFKSSCNLFSFSRALVSS